ncbi:GNAT family N-acetyltransferase [Novosphingobium sp.]|uniref:GNAT family N-acetyltransferase n=1 Tax=Novosphingobium sp. TaxID=1874826 RepID=UPI0027373DEF|nr:GNAT family N-acetyltransferase [Novosphingobium sp.]MDP3907255.1 GNAT family N-acetyltransferase [Novosphingobium sp.]
MTPPGDDLDQIMAVMATAFDPAYGEAWNRRQVEDALVLSNCHYGLIAPHGGEPEPAEEAAGFFMSRTAFDEEELLLIAIAPQYRGRGLGQTLLARFAGAARQRGVTRLLLEMRRGNPAERLYRQAGFLPVGERPNYYRMTHGERIDAITFACAID